MTDAELKKRVSELIDLDNYTNKCAAGGKPDILHRGMCTRTEKEQQDELNKTWNEFRKQVTVIVKCA